MLSDNSLPNMMIQSKTNNHCALLAFTFVESPLQISSFLTNKANFRKSQMNVNKVLTKDYENIANWTLGENKPNTKPNKANFRKAKMNVNIYSTKDYENLPLCRRGENKPNTNPNKPNFTSPQKPAKAEFANILSGLYIRNS